MTATSPPRFNPFAPEAHRDPYPIYRELRAAAPVHRTMGMWVLTRHADVHAVLRDRSFGAGLIPRLVRERTDREPGADSGRVQRLAEKSLVFTEDPDHARLRALVNAVFTPRAVAALRPGIVEVAERLVATACARGAMDAVTELATPLPLTVLANWMALPDDLPARVGGWTHDIRFLLEPGLMRPADVAGVCSVVEEFAAAIENLVDDRRDGAGDDLITRLVAARTRGGDRLADEEVVFVAIMCFVAGLETTSSLIGNTLLALLRHPDQAARVQDAPELAQVAVAETLRYDSPLQMTKRVASAATTIADRPVAAGDQILLCLGAANRDPAIVDAPDEFRLDRPGRGHLAFGHGMHGCLGAALAQAQAEVALEVLHRRARGVAAVDEPVEENLDRQRHSLIVRGLSHLPVVLQ